MAQTKRSSSNSGSGSSRKSGSSRSGSNGNGRRASQKTEKYRFAQNLEGQPTMAEKEYLKYVDEGADMGGDPDVLLDVPVVKVDSIHFELEDLDARVALKAQVLDLERTGIPAPAGLGRCACRSGFRIPTATAARSQQHGDPDSRGTAGQRLVGEHAIPSRGDRPRPSVT